MPSRHCLPWRTEHKRAHRRRRSGRSPHQRPRRGRGRGAHPTSSKATAPPPRGRRGGVRARPERRDQPLQPLTRSRCSSNEAGRYPAAHRRRKRSSWAKRIEEGRHDRQGADDQLQTCGWSSRLRSATRRRASRSATSSRKGVLGLIRAAEKFDWRKGFKFLDLREPGGFARRCSAASPTKARTIPAIPVPRRRGASRRLPAPAASSSQRSSVTRRPEGDLGALEVAAQPCRGSDGRCTRGRIDRHAGGRPTEDASFGDLIAGTGPSTEEEASSSLRDLAVRQAVANLPDRERDVIELRFGARR